MVGIGYSLSEKKIEKLIQKYFEHGKVFEEKRQQFPKYWMKNKAILILSVSDIDNLGL